MEILDRVDAQHTTASRCGSLLAFLQDGKLRVNHVASTARCLNEYNIKIPSKEIINITWSDDGTRIAVSSYKQVEIAHVDDPSHHVRLDNGGGGLGRFASAAFLDNEHLLTTWEFGRGRIWHLSSGRSTEIGDLKTTSSGQAWSQRPRPSSAAPDMISILSRVSAEDVLTIHFVEDGKSTSRVSLPTVDAQSLCWSPDGRWLAVVDTPTAASTIHFCTPDGHLYRSYPPKSSSDANGLGVKVLEWAGDSSTVALAGHDGGVVLLNTRSFTTFASLEHSTTIDQSGLPQTKQAPIWQEHVSAASERTYSLATQPVSPPLSRGKPSTESDELGVAELCFSSNGEYLATRDERMLSTVWIWSKQTLSAHTVIMQHANVRKMLWHPSRPDLLMLDCGESVAYLLAVGSSSPPMPVMVPLPGTPILAWLETAVDASPAILALTKTSFRVIFPEGRPAQVHATADERASALGADIYEEGTSEDSIMDVLSGRKPRTHKSEQSYTERIDMEANGEDATMGLDDTFRAKRRPLDNAVEVDPLDDSEIF
ncbi:hypothetical protein LTR86_000936 [Recurvomyces mirabilis]|nr:hypothetical protein LTR86_000936 [Recurvomyces mirabilis]